MRLLDDFEYTVDISTFPREDLMYLAELSITQILEYSKVVDE